MLFLRIDCLKDDPDVVAVPVRDVDVGARSRVRQVSPKHIEDTTVWGPDCERIGVKANTVGIEGASRGIHVTREVNWVQILYFAS